MTARLSPTHGAIRALRGGLLAVTSGGLAVAAHTVAGGQAPDTALAVVLTGLLAGAGTALADRRRGLPAILAVLGSSQVALHVLLTALSTHPHGSGIAAVDPLAMTIAHIAAALGAAWLLADAESAVFALFSALTMLLPKRLAPLPAVAPLWTATPAPAPESARRDLRFRRVLPRRGPPVAV